MIHLTIPTFQTFLEKYDTHKKYHVYELHVNGAYHASVRYSALYSLHEKLLENFGLRLDSAEFPPKKIWRNLDDEGANKRREGLARYFRAVLKNADISKHPILERSFLDFQVNSFMPAINGVKLEILLPNGQAIHVDSRSDDNSGVVLKKIGSFLNISDESINNFGLFLTKTAKEPPLSLSSLTNKTEVVRWLKNFESPFISQQLANRDLNEHQAHFELSIRKAIFDPSMEELMLDDPGSLKILFMQAVNDIESGAIKMSSEIRVRLEDYKNQKLFKQYLHLCHQQADYGYEIFPNVKADFPNPNSDITFKIGRHQVVIEYEEDSCLHNYVIRSQRIRLWKVSETDQNKEMWFHFSYDSNKGFNEMKLRTDHAVLYVLYLHAIANEILKETGRITPTYTFYDQISTKIIEKLEASKANSIVSDDLSDHQSPLSDSNGLTPEVLALFKIISHQMPFGNESFKDITNDDL